MSDPRTDYRDPVEGAMSELISAQSALNMEPEALEQPDGPYISDLDKWAKHAYDHIAAAMEMLQGVLQTRARR